MTLNDSQSLAGQTSSISTLTVNSSLNIQLMICKRDLLLTQKKQRHAGFAVEVPRVRRRENENITYELLNLGNTYFHRLEVLDELGLPNPGEDTCYEFDNSGINNVLFSPSSSGITEDLSSQTSFVLENNFMSYFLGNNDYEILSISDTEIQAKKLIAYCGLEWDDACLDFHKTERTVKTASITQVRQPIYKSSVERWRSYESHLTPLFEALGDLAPK